MENEKIYKAFLHMLETAKERGREVVVFNNSIRIRANGKEGVGLIGEVEFSKKMVKTLKKDYYFWKDYDYSYKEIAHGRVINPEDEERFYFNFEDLTRVEEIKSLIRTKQQEQNDEEGRKREQSLEKLLC